MKTLVISGDGCKGSLAGGIAEYFIMDCCHHYDTYVGCSMGSLLLPQVALKKIDKIKKIFTSVRQEDVFSICPFNIKKTANCISIKINHFNTVRSFIKGCATFGESHALRKLIHQSILPDEIQQIKDNNVNIILAVSNLTKDTVEYIHASDNNHEELCDWTVASCNYIPFMNVFSKNGYQYADGEFSGFIPIKQAIEQGATEVDDIVLEPQNGDAILHVAYNPFALLLHTFHFMNLQNSIKDLVIRNLMGLNRKVNINQYHTPHIFTDNPLHFRSKQMAQLWKDGYEYARSNLPVKFCNEGNYKTLPTPL